MPKAGSRKATGSVAPCRRIAAARRRPRPRPDRATVATANPQKHPHGKRRVPAGNATLDLFGETSLPEGMKYQPNFLSADEERALLYNIEGLPFREFEFHGFTGKRKTVSFGWRYDFNGG